jgi:pantoate--beta-alanine ligase
MTIITKKTQLQSKLNAVRAVGQTVGFVPTMGALHDGHMSLVRAANRQCDVVVVSIFVNPTQFNNPHDLSSYPRQIDADTALLAQNANDVLVFLPEVEEMYPPNDELLQYDLNGFDTVMEGEKRPGHFQGVAAVVDRFFQMVGPCTAFFGEKDFQQLTIIRHIACKFHPNVTVVGVPTRREADGLAMSSRNMLLTPTQRREAPIIYSSLLRFVRDLHAGITVQACKQAFVEAVEQHQTLNVEYIELAAETNLILANEPIENGRLFTAVFAGKVRLIDNVAL